MYNFRVGSLITLVAYFCYVAATPIANVSRGDAAAVSKQHFASQVDGVDQYVLDDTFQLKDVPSYLASKSTFYRAVVREELEFLTQNYPKDRAPTRHGTSGGDFTVDNVGGLYVFDEEAEAAIYGRCSSQTPQKDWPHSYVVTFQYTPNPKLRTQSFKKDDASWKTLVNNCAKNIPHTYEIVEGPFSLGAGDKRKGAARSGKDKQTEMLWQAAFIGQDALHTLKVTNLRKVNTFEGKWPSCSIF